MRPTQAKGGRQRCLSPFHIVHKPLVNPVDWRLAMLHQKKTAPRTDLVWVGLMSAVLCLLLAPWKSFAHDPGLSTGQLRLLPDRIETELTFARADIEALVPLDADGDGEVRPLELAAAKPALETLARTAWAIRVDDRAAVVEAPAVRFNDTSNVCLTATFPTPATGALTAKSLLLDRLPRGHRQFVMLLDRANGVRAETLLSAGQNVLVANLEPMTGPQATPPTSHTFRDFLKLGLEHIATGYDHLLFLLALLILAPGFRQAALVITSFTVAHSITLGLATLHVVTVPSRIVEPLIAATIVYVGVENLVRREAPRGRCLLTFAFGLVHGLGFASVLRELGVSSGTTGIAMPLLSFNLGVEAGQMAIASLVLPLIWLARKSPPVVRYGVPVASSAVMALGGWWLLERTIL